MFKIILVLGIGFVSFACGVKSRPLTPLNPPEIGKGGANFNDIFDEKNEKKKKKKDK